ncbi:MAG TPA: SDR family oxidoreductase [Sandaracinaceae bacterium LLY-WYZ-13_1]|nr:SDR family oxidoreductase [Sandaracinaceae bacterium LLY-WYZ-13_1]
MADQLFRSGLFEGQSAIVTGGGTGIGLAVARELGRLGARVAICGRRAEPLAEAAEGLEAEGITVHHGTADIREPETIEAYLEGVKEAFGEVDVLVNNAGGQFPSPAQHISPKGFEAVVRNNLLGTFNFTHAVANAWMIPQQRGRIVNVIAQVARGFPGMAHTGAARAGVDNLTKSLAVEWAQFGVRVNAVAPGVIETSGTKQYPPQLLEEAVKATPLRRLGHADEVSHLIVYLASTYADFVTGQSFYIDGGASLWGDQWPIPPDVPQSPPYPTD